MKKEIELAIKDLETGMIKCFKKDGFVAPFFFALAKGKKDEDMMFTCPILNMEKRRDAASILGKEILKMEQVKHVDAVVMVSEAWASVINKGDPRYDNPMLVKPSQDPNRKEIAQISAMTDAGEVVFRTYEMKDKKDKEKRSLTPFHLEGFDKAETFLLKEFWKGYGVII